MAERSSCVGASGLLRWALTLACMALAGVAPLNSQQPAVDVQSYHFRIDIPDTGTTINGLASVIFETRAGWDDTLRLDLVGMAVRRVFDIHTMRTLPIIHDGRVLKVAMRGAAAARPRGVVVEYRGSPSDGLIIRTNARGRRSAFGDNWPERARHWLPVVDHPSDKARVLWSIRVPQGWRGVANQPECRATGSGRQRRVRCDESRPIPTYTMVLGATELTRSVHRPLLRGADTIPIEVWAYPEDSAWADSVPFRRATEVAEVLQRLIGPFPYGKLSHVQSSTRFGGMENATVVFYNEQLYLRRALRDGTVRHETAHQWFGDAVTPREWAHLWLSEGFAVYFDWVSGTLLEGDSVLPAAVAAAMERVMGSDVIGRPVIDSTVSEPGRLLNPNSYQKGALVLHMLRGEIGDSAFFRGVRDYYRLYRDSSVLTQQLQRVMERAAGRGLGWFFDQWLRQPGFPRLEVSWRPAAAGAELLVTQAQDPAWGFFRLPALPLELLLPGGERLVRTVALEARGGPQRFVLDLPAAPESVLVDPRRSLLLQAAISRD